MQVIQSKPRNIDGMTDRLNTVYLPKTPREGCIKHNNSEMPTLNGIMDNLIRTVSIYMEKIH